MATQKTSRHPPIEGKPNGRPKTETAWVSHPSLEGYVETVQRNIDTLDVMRKRKQLSEREYQAADRIRMAHERLNGAIGGAGDFERSPGGSLPGRPPAVSYLIAADTLRDAKLKIYPKHYAIVYQVCIEGRSIEQAAAHFYQGVPTRQQKEEAGWRLREGLGMIADEWYGPENSNGSNRMRSHISERPSVTDVQSVPRSSTVAHATRDRVVRGGGID